MSRAGLVPLMFGCVVFANRNGELRDEEKMGDWESPFRFPADGAWYYVRLRRRFQEPFCPSGIHLNDYKFGTLECREPQDSDSRLYIIVDGALVDSCPRM